MPNPLTTKNALNSTSDYAYDPQNRLVAERDARGAVTNYTYRPDGLLTGRTDALNQTTIYTYTTFTYTGGLTGTLLTSERDARGTVTTYGYDPLGRLTSVTNSLNQVSTFSYDAAGRLTQQTTPEGRRTCWEYTAADQIAARIEACAPNQASTASQNLRTSYSYDALGRQIWIRNALGEVTRTVFNGNNQVVETIIGCAVGGVASTTNCDPYSGATPQLNRSTTTTYDGVGRPSISTDVLNIQTTYDYTTLGQVLRVTRNYVPNQPATATQNVITTTEYDAAGRPIASVDPLGRRSVTRYDAVGRISQTIQNYVDGNPTTGTADSDLITATEYDATGRVTATIENYVNGLWDAAKPDEDRKTVTQYDLLGRVTATIETYVDGIAQAGEIETDRITEYRYDALGNPTATIDPLGLVTVNRYDSQNRLSETITNCTNGSGVSQTSGCAVGHGTKNDENLRSSITYSSDGRVATRTDAAGRRTRYRYDQFGRQDQVIRNDGGTGTPANVTTTFGFNQLGQTVAVTDTLGNVQRSEYNSAGWLTRSLDPTQRATTYRYDGVGRRIGVVDGLSHETRTIYDALGRSSAVIQNYQDGIVDATEPADQDLITASDYDAASRQTALILPDGRRTTYGYDGLDRMTSVTENANGMLAPINVTTTYGYDRRGLRTSTLDAEGRTWTTSYNAANWLSAERDPLNRVWTTSYNRRGQQTQTTDPRTVSVSYGYDMAGRMTSISGSQGLSVSMGYDLLGRRTSMSDGTGAQTFGYNDLDLMTSSTHVGRNSVAYSYDALGRRTQVAVAGGASQSYSYDAAGRMDIMQVNGVFYADGNYDAAGRLTTLNRGSGTSTTTTYDNANRVIGIQTATNSTVQGGFSYILNRLGQALQITEQVAPPPPAPVSPPPVTAYHAYLPMVLYDNIVVTDYAYDGLGRLSMVQDPAETTLYAYDRVGNRTSENQQTFSYNAANERIGWSYDAAGNLLNDGRTTATYDERNRVTSMTVATNTTQYRYTGDGVLAGETDNGSVTEYVVDRAGSQDELLGRLGSSPRWIYHGYGQALGASNEGSHRYLTDRLGSVRAVIKTDGTIGANYTYTPFGERSSTPYYHYMGFTGEYQQPWNSAVYLRARWYNPTSGTFFSKDPFAGNPTEPQSLHRSAYVHNDPVNMTDPSGLWACDEGNAKYQKYCSNLKLKLKNEVDPYINKRFHAKRINNNAVDALNFLLTDTWLPGGERAKSIEGISWKGFTEAQEHLEFAFWVTQSGNFTHFDIPFDDNGFAQNLRDSMLFIGGYSSNQVGHFLTGSHLGYDPGWIGSVNAIACIIGHEQVSDHDPRGSGPLGESSLQEQTILLAQCAEGSFKEVEQFTDAMVADATGDYATRDCLIAQILPDLPETHEPWDKRWGNSRQDLRLSIKGYQFGAMVAQQKIRTSAEVTNWINRNLR